MTSSPLVSVMVWPASLPAKWMVSPALGGGDLGPQRAGAAVQVVGDRQRAEQPAILEHRERGPEGCPPARGAVSRVGAHWPGKAGGCATGTRTT